ncbi:MAG: CDC27 family protein [Flavobacterium sp.]|nr:CDC27 family protein [Flavobacterium sp.]
MIKNIVYITIFLGILFQPITLWSQEEPEDIALDTDEFQVFFYESLKQKGIENYDKAINALERCEKLQPNNPVVYFELGKNYFSQKDYSNAYENFEKATKIDQNNRWYWAGLYDVAFAMRDYDNAINHLNKLITFKKEYKEELVKVYMTTQKFDKALDLITELEESIGKSEQRSQYKAQIMSLSKYKGQEKSSLEAAISKYPKEESNYIALIYIYSEENQYEKAFEVARQLEKEIPSSDWAQVSLFKFYLEQNEADKAIAAMDRAISSSKIDKKIKHRVFNEFIVFAKDDPKYVATIDKAITYFKDDKEISIAKELGKFYQNKANWANASKYYEMQFNNTPEDIENRMLLLQAYVETNRFEPLVDLSDKSLELYPLQPDFYYYAGLANNQLKKHKKAKDLLESGLDYIVDNPKLEANFYIQLGEAYNGLGDMKNKEIYFTKAEKLLKQIK